MSASLTSSLAHGVTATARTLNPDLVSRTLAAQRSNQNATRSLQAARRDYAVLPDGTIIARSAYSVDCYDNHNR